MEGTTALSGVEITEESRYIDHTNATTFEEHCAEIQGYLTDATAAFASEKYLSYHSAGQSMATVVKCVDLRKVEGITRMNDESEAKDVVNELFQVKQYVAVVATEDDMHTFTPSMKSYVYSSLITAAAAISTGSCSAPLQSGGEDSIDHRSLPVFFYGKCEHEIYGYHRQPISYCVDAIRHFISYVLDDIDRESPLYYFDGLLSTFYRDISNFVNQGEVTKTVFVDLIERFVIPYPPLEISGQVFNDHPVMQNTIEDLWFSSSDFSPYTDQSFALTVNAQWKNVKHSSIIENSRFSTFHPSKLSPECWCVELLSDLDMERALPLSRCLRKLFTLYLFGKSGSRKTSVSEFLKSEDSGMSSEVFRKTKFMAAVLSPNTRGIVDDMIENASTLTDKSDFEEYLMKLNARFLWINRGGLENLGLTPWNWLKDLGAAPVGSWLSLAAIYVGFKDSLFQMLDIWQEFVRDLRIHQESGVPIARLNAPIPIDNGESGVSLNQDEFDGKSETEYCHELFWGDIVTEKRSRGTPFVFPDSGKSIMYQKLQLLQMCILCKDESVYTSIELKNNDAAFFDKAGIIVPKLMRRMPTTHDSQLQQQFMAETVNSGEKDASVDHPLLKWQVSHPAVVADCRAFKAVNPEAPFEEFLSFYEITSLVKAAKIGFQDDRNVDLYREVLRSIFDACDGMPTEEQKPLFKASMEGEKILHYMESISIISMASELLQNAMVAIHFLLCHTHSDLESYSSFCECTQTLEASIKAAVSHLKTDVSLFDEVDSSSVCQTTLFAIDKVCEDTQKLEDLICKLKFLSTATELPNRLIEKLSVVSTSVKADTNEEAEILLGMAKYSSSGETSEWRSRDGRALREPTLKSYMMTIYGDDYLQEEKVHTMRADLKKNTLRVSSMRTEYAYY